MAKREVITRLRKAKTAHIRWRGYAQALIAGVFVGSALWWAMLTGVAGLFRRAINQSGLRWVNRVSAAVILICGVVILISAVAPDSPIAAFLDDPFR